MKALVDLVGDLVAPTRPWAGEVALVDAVALPTAPLDEAVLHVLVDAAALAKVSVDEAVLHVLVDAVVASVELHVVWMPAKNNHDINMDNNKN